MRPRGTRPRRKGRAKKQGRPSGVVKVVGSGVGRPPILSRFEPPLEPVETSKEITEWKLEVLYLEEVNVVDVQSWAPVPLGPPNPNDSLIPRAWPPIETKPSSPQPQPAPLLPTPPPSEADPYADYPFTHNRYITKDRHRLPDGSTKVEAKSDVTYIRVRSPYLFNVGTEVMSEASYSGWPSAFWNPDILLAHFWYLEGHLTNLMATVDPSEEEQQTIAHLSLLLGHLQMHYAALFADIERQLSNSEIRFDSLWALFLPGKIFFMKCNLSGESRAVRLINAQWTTAASNIGGLEENWALAFEYIDGFHGKRKSSGSVEYYGYAWDRTVTIRAFRGTRSICTLPAYPIEFHPDSEGLKAYLVERGKRWCSLRGVHHKFYDGAAFNGASKVHVTGRIILDRENFVQEAGGGLMPVLCRLLNGEAVKQQAEYGQPAEAETNFDEYTKELSEDELILTTPFLSGFDLQNKTWVTFQVTDIQDIEWNEAVFENLVLPASQKDLVKSLVSAHASVSTQFDDFVEGKGQGLVINIFGNPGVGKTLTAEATSEHLRKPLYVVGASELGTSADILDPNLSRIFRLAGQWGAVALIDEADVFLEQRSLYDIKRNSMVAVFLRQLEYFKSILFLTTNRVRSFDVAFQSRIHVSLHYEDLTADSKAQIWISFMKKALDDPTTQSSPTSGLSEAQLGYLTTRGVNGRQIKNAVRTACAIASSEDVEVSYEHLVQVLDVMEGFDYSFKYDDKQIVPI